MFEEVNWIDELDAELPANYKGDLVSGIALMEKIHDEESKSDSGNEDN